MGAGYQWNPKDYARNSTAQLDWARELIGKLDLHGDEDLLDIGCGDGKVSAALSDLLPRGRVLGIDSSSAMVVLAQSSHPQSQHANLSFAQADARTLSYEARFDVVFSNATLHWVQGHEAVLAGIDCSLKPGGRFLLQMGGRGNAAAIVTVMEEMIASPRWAKHFEDFAFPYGFYGPEEYDTWMASTALLPASLALIPKEMVHEDAAALTGWARTTWLPYTQRVAEAEREIFVDELVARYLEQHPPDGAGRTRVQMVRLEVEGRKAAGGVTGAGR
ncbi:MAG: methyltransferase domain-containing protein [Candidatus Latescibacteria bacterium]|jgi:trans-aconitate methyltransferase|nr:SAM-dependent methyltransferase [Gemmatimonadaceae bacterium]MDP7448334.1 methyltransferase domain-containing protein [Candidatus Latescibacterota bacterium]HJP30487.1 methyltransferase domain-containing protein [Candidatus Latescibacterota bacterium]